MQSNFYGSKIDNQGIGKGLQLIFVFFYMKVSFGLFDFLKASLQCVKHSMSRENASKFPSPHVSYECYHSHQYKVMLTRIRLRCNLQKFLVVSAEGIQKYSVFIQNYGNYVCD